MASTLGRRVYATKRWKIARFVALERANWRCQRCGKAGRLEVHHRQRVVDDGAFFDPDNLEAVCRPCHFARHGQAAPVRRPDRSEWRRFALER